MNSCDSVASQIPEKILVKTRLLLKSLHRFKFVSKSWSSLITHQILPKIPPSPLLGFFHHFDSYCLGPQPLPSNTNNDEDDNNDDGYDFFPYVDRNNNARDTNISTTLYFLSWLHHRRAYHFFIVDSCNGLLCEPKERYYYVCNLATLSYTELPKDNNFPYYCLLDFDPRVSRHYKVIVICSGNVWFDVYYLERRGWEKKRVDPAICKGYYSEDKRHCALWNGAIYFYMQRKRYADEDFQTLRFGLLDGNIGYECHQVLNRN